MLARILTEDVNSERVRELCDKYLEGYTLLRGVGVWKGKLEPCIVIEVAWFGWEVHVREEVYALAKTLKVENKQEAVLIEFVESNNVLV